MQADNPASGVHAHSRTQFLEQTVHQISLVFYIPYFVLPTVSFISALMSLVWTLWLRHLESTTRSSTHIFVSTERRRKGCSDFDLCWTHFYNYYCPVEKYTNHCPNKSPDNNLQFLLFFDIYVQKWTGISLYKLGSCSSSRRGSSRANFLCIFKLLPWEKSFNQQNNEWMDGLFSIYRKLPRW